MLFQERVLVSPDSLSTLRPNTPMSSLTVNFLIWSDINRSCDGCSNYVNTCPDAAQFPLTGCTGAGRDPAYPLGPEAP